MCQRCDAIVYLAHRACDSRVPYGARTTWPRPEHASATSEPRKLFLKVSLLPREITFPIRRETLGILEAGFDLRVFFLCVRCSMLRVQGHCISYSHEVAQGSEFLGFYSRARKTMLDDMSPPNGKARGNMCDSEQSSSTETASKATRLSDPLTMGRDGYELTYDTYVKEGEKGSALQCCPASPIQNPSKTHCSPTSGTHQRREDGALAVALK